MIDGVMNLASARSAEAVPIAMTRIDEHVTRNGHLTLGRMTETDLNAVRARPAAPPAGLSGPVPRDQLPVFALVCDVAAHPHEDRLQRWMCTESRVERVPRDGAALYGRDLVGEHPNSLFVEPIDFERLALLSLAGFQLPQIKVTLQTARRERARIVGATLGHPLAASAMAPSLSEFMALVRTERGTAHPDGNRMYYRTLDPLNGMGERLLLLPVAWSWRFEIQQ